MNRLYVYIYIRKHKLVILGKRLGGDDADGEGGRSEEGEGVDFGIRALKGDSGGAKKVAIGGQCHWYWRLRCVYPPRR